MDFNALLQQAQKLTNDTQGTDELPRVERTLPQVLQATHELHSRVTQIGAQDIQAHILLGSKGIDLPKISQKLETLSTRKTFEPLDPISDTDIQSFLRNERENAILSVIEEVHKNSYTTAQEQKWEHIMNDWRQEKVKLMNALVGPSQNFLDIRKGPEQTILSDIQFNSKSCLDHQEMAYARKVYAYNQLVVEGASRPSLVQEFEKVALDFNDAKITEMWEIMKFMVTGPQMARNQDPLKARVERTQFVEQAKRYLENRYKLYMQAVATDHLREAQRGGVPSVADLVKSYVGLKFGNPNSSCIGMQEMYDDGTEVRPLWALVYYSLRCGNIQAACAFLNSASGHDDLFKVLMEKQKNPDQPINNKLEMVIKLQYKRVKGRETDPFKKAVYCILGCCDVNDHHPEVAKTSDDFLWIQLNLIRPDSNDSTDHYTYAAFQTMILEQYGERHYNAQEQPHLYFQVLALTGQFEAAIEFLSRFERYRTHAVHFALALNEMGFLAGPRNIQGPLLSVDIDDPTPMRRLNLARLIMLYVKKFEVTDPAEALQYFYFLRDMRDPEGRNLFLVCVSDLAIECREYGLIFGKVTPNGTRSRGLIDQFESIQVDYKVACDIVAEELVKKGLFEDAIKIFDLANNHQQALRYMSILMSQVVHQPTVKGSLRERLHMMTVEIFQRYAGENLMCDSETLSTFTTLRDLLEFFDMYHEKKFQLALEKLAKTKLVPLSVDDMDICLQNFKRLGGEICKVFPDLLLATMDILLTQYKAIKGKDGPTFGNTGKENQLAFLRGQAKAITNIAAAIPYRMPGDTNKRLVQTEILMH